MENPILIELAKIALKMRKAQRDYFATKRRDCLIRAKVLEREFDKLAETLTPIKEQ
jgi:hypothetical protein